ncbi:MAG: sugar phosphate isomerase/epimerase [Planctomycetaceae bacterium]|nr:sugar phosphate isomerase/epimerase [Planctomycetaceae bacterium]
MAEIRLSCYAAPWGNDGNIQAITDVADCGYEGLEFPSEVVRRFEDRLHVFEEILDTTGLKLSGLLQRVNLLDKDKADEQVEKAANSARFAGSTGRGNLIICQSEPTAGPLSDDAWLTVGAMIEVIGCRCQAFGITLCVMPRARHLGDSDKDLKRILAITNPEVVSLAVDTAELVLAGVDPSKIIKTHQARLRSIRFRDVSGAKRRADVTSSKPGSAPQFGRGAVDFEAVSKTLIEIKYDGWITIDITGEATPPKEAALSGYRFVMRRSGLFPY